MAPSIAENDLTLISLFLSTYSCGGVNAYGTWMLLLYNPSPLFLIGTFSLLADASKYSAFFKPSSATSLLYCVFDDCANRLYLLTRDPFELSSFNPLITGLRVLSVDDENNLFNDCYPFDLSVDDSDVLKFWDDKF